MLSTTCGKIVSSPMGDDESIMFFFAKFPYSWRQSSTLHFLLPLDVPCDINTDDNSMVVVSVTCIFDKNNCRCRYVHFTDFEMKATNYRSDSRGIFRKLFAMAVWEMEFRLMRRRTDGRSVFRDKWLIEIRVPHYNIVSTMNWTERIKERLLVCVVIELKLQFQLFQQWRRQQCQQSPTISLLKNCPMSFYQRCVVAKNEWIRNEKRYKILKRWIDGVISPISGNTRNIIVRRTSLQHCRLGCGIFWRVVVLRVW